MVIGNQVLHRIIAKNIVWRGFYDSESESWIGVCDALNLNAIGDTWDELQACGNDAMAGLFASLLKHGELDQFLTANGWARRGESPKPGQNVRFDIPADWKETARSEEFAEAR